MYDIQFMKLSTLQEIFKLDYISLLKQSYLQYFFGVFESRKVKLRADLSVGAVKLSLR